MGKTQSLPKYDGEGAKVVPVFRFSAPCIICGSGCNQEIKRDFMGGRRGLALDGALQGGPRWRHSGGRAGMHLETGKYELCHLPKGQHNHYH